MKETTQQEREILHGKILQNQADRLWGWQTPAGEKRAARRAELFFELGHMSAGSKVLELGCGTGEFSQRIAPRVAELWATDVSPDLLQRAEQRVRSACPAATVRFSRQDATQLAFDDRSFDAVFGNSMLHHVDVPSALRETRRVLADDGWCVFCEPNMLNPQLALQQNVSFLRRRFGYTEDETALFSWKVKRWLEQAGFTSIIVRHFDFLHPLTPRFLVPVVGCLGRLLEQIPGLRILSGSMILCGRKSPAA